MMEDALAGCMIPCEDPNFWGQDVPLSGAEKTSNMFAGFGKRVSLRRGRNWLAIDPDNLKEE